MSIDHISAVWDSGLYDGPELLMMLALADYADADNACWPRYDTLALRVRRDVKSVYRVLAALEASGAIRRHGNRIYITEPVILEIVERRAAEKMEFGRRAAEARTRRKAAPEPVALPANPPEGILKNENGILKNENGILKNENAFYIDPSDDPLNDPIGAWDGVTVDGAAVEEVAEEPAGEDPDRAALQRAWEATVELIEFWEELTQRKHPPLESADFRDHWVIPFNEIWIMCGRDTGAAKAKVQAVRDDMLSRRTRIFDPAKLPAHVRALVDMELLPVTRHMNGAGKLAAPVPEIVTVGGLF